jgi:DNA-binding NtrC family response regulator
MTRLKDISFHKFREAAGRKGHLLVVDDDPAVLDLLQHLFTRLGYEITTAGGGREALAIFEPGSFDCIVSDLAMPGMDGIELLKKIRLRDDKVPFLVVTGYPTIETAVEAMKLGAFDYITKPFDKTDIEIKVERALYTRGLEKSLQAVDSRMKTLLTVVPVIIILAVILTWIWKG